MDWIVWVVIGGVLVLFLLNIWAMLMTGEPIDLDEEWRCLQEDEERRRRKKKLKEAKP